MKPTMFFLGVDPAPSDSQRSDDGALAIGAATPKGEERGEAVGSDNPADWDFDFCWARVLTHKEKASSRQWSGLIHELDGRFGFEKILMDPGSGGGGVYVQRELRAQKQLIQGIETEVTPIVDQVDGPKLVARGKFILHMFKRGDPGIELVWPDPSNAGKSLAGDELLKDGLLSSFKEAIDSGMVAWPAGEADLGEWREEIEGKGGEQRTAWTEERIWALRNLAAGTVQLKGIMVATREDGTHLFTKRGAHQFASMGRDDIAMAMMLARGAFLIWLRSDDWRQKTAPEDAEGFLGW